MGNSYEEIEMEGANDVFVNAEGSPEDSRSDGVDSDLDQDDIFSLFYGIDMADPVAVKLDDLIQR